MSSEESVVLVGGRRNLPQIFVEHEQSGQLRFRREGSAASEGSTGGNQTGSTSTPANYGIPGSYSTSFHMPAPADQRGSTPPPGLGKHHLDQSADSGYSGWGGDTVRKTRPADLSSSYASSSSEKSGDASFWSLVSSPVADLKKRIKGRQSFVEDESPQFSIKKIEPQHIMAGIVIVVLLASVGFALLIGVRHFNMNEALNGKQRSIKYGTEKRAATLRKEGRLIEDDILDESGNALGGKRAAMQFAHNKAKRDAPVEPTEAPVEPTEAPVEPTEVPGKLEVPEPEPVEKIPAPTLSTVNIKSVESLSLSEVSERMRELSLLLAAESKQDSPAATKLVHQIDALKRRKRELVSKLQQSRSNRVIREQEEMEEEVEDTAEEEKEQEEEAQEEGASSKEESLARLSQYEQAMAQLTELTDKLATAKSVGGDGGETSATDKTPTKSKSAARLSISKEAVESPVLSGTQEKPRARAPKTRYTNPLTGTLPGMSKAKLPAVKASAAGATVAAAAPRPLNLEAEVQRLERRLTELKGAVASKAEEQAEARDDPDYPDLPTFRRSSPPSQKKANHQRSKRQARSQDKDQGGKFRKKTRPSDQV